MKKLKKVKRVLSILLTGLIGLNAISLTAIAESTDPALFIVNGYFIEGYVGDETDIVLPTEVNGVTMTSVRGNAFKDNTTITSIVIPEGYTYLAGSAIRGCTALKSVSLPNTLESLGTMQFRDCTALESVNVPYGINNINSYAFYGCTNPNLVIDIQGVSVTTVGSNAFTNVTGTINTYSQDVYDLVKEKATTANVVLIDNKFENLQKAIDDSKTYVNNQYYYTSDSYALLSEALAVGNSLLENENATTEEITAAATAINNAISGLTYKGFTEFDKVLAQAEDLVYNHRYEYTYESWSRLSRRYVDAKEYKESVTGEITEYIQMQINNHENYMLSGINGLVALDKTEVFNELVQTIETAESYGSEDFTDESYAELAKALESAKALTEASSFEELALAKQAINNALENLKIKPGIEEEAGEPFAIINKNAVETTLGEFTADDNTAGATKIKITFDCASDVSFNQYASIEVKATINGTENYMKFAGTDSSQTAGAKGWTVELPLTNAINPGNDVMLVAYTWAWANASDYVYAVTKVEYINDVGQVVKVVTDRTLALDELKTTIAEAELISGETYTEDSYAELTAALTAAKDVSDDAEKADIEAAKTALETAVAGLVEKTDDSVSEPTPDSEPNPESTPDSESSLDTDDTDSETSSKRDDESSSQTDDSSSKTDDSANESTSKTDSAGSDSKANTTNNANSGANGTSNPNTGAKSAAAVVILLSAIGVIASRKK